MKTFTLCSMAALAIFMMASCAPYQARGVFGLTYTSGFTSSGGLMRIYPDGTAEPLPPSGKVIDLPLSAGNLGLRFDPPYSEGAYRSLEQWYVDGQLRQQTDAGRGFYGFTFENRADGTHDVRLVVYWAYAGDRRSAGTDTLQIRVRTWRDVY